MINRPLTPHLTIYSSQFTSKYSIWHRITGLTLISLLLFYINFFKVNFLLFVGLLDNFLNYLPIQNIIIINSVFIFIYHLLSGFKYIKWDLGYLTTIKTMVDFYVSISFSLLFVIIILMLKIIN